MNWDKVKLGNYVNTLKGFAFKSAKYTNDGVPIVRASNFTMHSISFDDIKYYSKEDALGYKKYRLNAYDVLVQTVGSWQNNPASVVGKVIYVPSSFVGALLNQNIVKLSPSDSERLDNRFLYYRLKNNDFKQHNLGNAVGAANQASITLETIRNFIFELPPIETQRRIANILSTYDNLIVNNQKQIKLLEEAAMRLYKEWFVNMRFPGYETTKIVDGVPEGWSSCKLADVIDFNPKVVLPKNKVKKTIPMSALSTDSMVVDETQISFTHSNSGSKFSNYDTLLARITPCLENGKTAFVDFLEEGEIAVGSTEFIVMRSKKLNPYIVYCIARNESFRGLAINSMAGADGRQRVKLDLIKDIKFLLPTEKIIESCHNYMEPLFKKIKVLRKQNLLLSQSRDKLLPKLMSGEIEL